MVVTVSGTYCISSKQFYFSATPAKETVGHQMIVTKSCQVIEDEDMSQIITQFETEMSGNILLPR